MLKGKNHLGLNSSVSSNNDVQKGPNLGELDPSSSVTLLTRWKRVFYEISNISTGGEPTLGGLISSQFLDLCIDMHKSIRSNTADVIDL